MKVLQINARVDRGSVARITKGIHQELIKEKYSGKIAYGRGTVSGLKKNDTIKIGTNFECERHALLSRITDKTGFYSKKGTIHFIKEIDYYKPDIIHMHGNYGYYINIKFLFEYLSNLRIPVIITLHSCWDFTGHCCYFDYVKCEKWKKSCHNCPQKKEYPKSYFLDSSSWNYKNKKRLLNSISNMTLVAPSYWMAQTVRESFLSSFPVKVIHNGIDLEKFKSKRNKYFKNKYLCEGKSVLLGVANNWEKRKGLDTFIRLSKELPAGFQIILVGLTKEQRKRLPNNIIGLTQTDSIDELVELYSNASVFLNPTLEDNFPTTNLEALACGTPVITYNTGGSSECLNKDCGKVIDRGDYQSLKQCIITHDYPNNRMACIKQSKKFNQEEKFKKYLDLYRSLIL